MTLEKLLSASYKGVNFLVDGEQDLEGGRKGKKHKYVNRDTDFFEDLGQSPDVFTVTGLLHGEDVLDQVDNLRRVLNRKGEGVLVHPFFGRQTVTNEGYSIRVSTKRLNTATFEVVFSVTTQQIFPSADSVNNTLVPNLSVSNSDLISDNLANTFSVSTNSAINYDSAVSELNRVADAFDITGTSVYRQIGNLSSFTSIVDNFRNTIINNIFTPVTIASQIRDIFTEYNILASTASDQFLLFRRLFDFGIGDEIVSPTTVQRQERARNQQALNDTMRSTALVQAYGVTPQLEYKTDVEVKETEQILETQFEQVVDNNETLTTDTLFNIKNLRNETRKFFDQQLVNVYRVTEVKVRRQPLSLVSFDYYNQTDEARDIINLNGARNITNVTGDVKIFAKTDG